MMKSINWYPGHMKKTFDLMHSKIKEVDIVIELLDSRIPYSSSNPKINELFQNKRKIKILTKIDKIDSNKKLKEKMNEYYPDIPYLGINLLNIKDKTKIEKFIFEQASDYIEQKRKKGLKVNKLKLMIVGIPNVGKSTFINLLSNKNVTKVGDRPGVTTSQQWINISSKFLLLDMPGVLWPKFEDEQVAMNLAITNSIKRDVLPIDRLANHIFDHYLINNDLFKFISLEEYLLKYENEDGALEKLLNDFNNGKYGKFILD
jgi:ribosome biogenesis GTPase A